MEKFARYATFALLLALFSGFVPLSHVVGLDFAAQADTAHDSKSFISEPGAKGAAIGIFALAGQSDLIAHGQVLSSRSYWREGGPIIESEVRIALKQVFKGASVDEVSVFSPGGFLVEEEIGMLSPHEATFVPGEEVVILAREWADGYRLNGGANGKYSVSRYVALADLLSSEASLATLLETLDGHPGTVKSVGLIPRKGFDYSVEKGGKHQRSVVGAQNLVAGMRTWKAPATEVAFRVNVNTGQLGQSGRSAAEFLHAIRAASSTWNRVPGADFKLRYAGTTTATETGYNRVNEVLFMNMGAGNRGALAQVWYKSDLTIVEADIWINDDYEWDLSGKPGDQRLDLQSVLVHEFGHWLILNHSAVADSVMYPTLAPGAVRRTLHRSDAAGIVGMYPCRSSACLRRVDE